MQSGSYDVIIEGVKGQKGNIAIDDVILSQGGCQQGVFEVFLVLKFVNMNFACQACFALKSNFVEKVIVFNT